MSYNPLAFGLLLVSSGAILFSLYLFKFLRNKMTPEKEKSFGILFTLLGIMAGIFGFSIFFTQPIPNQYIEVYGVGYLIFTILLVSAGITMIFEWDKIPIAYFGFLAGIILLNSARTIYEFSLSKSPLATSALFALSGLGSISSVFIAKLGENKAPKWLVYLVILLVLATGLLAFYSGLNAQYSHVQGIITTVNG